jgi:hypothetical protein
MNLQRFFFQIAVLSLGAVACSDKNSQEAIGEKNELVKNEFIADPVQKLTELKAGDILVKPNNNLLPGSEWVLGGRGFGHAVLVLEDAQDTNTIQLLRKVKIFESQARIVPEAYELRKAPGYLVGSDYRFANTTFGCQNEGNRYRLRLGLTASQCDSIIRFVLAQDPDVSSWRSQKNFRNSRNKDSNDKEIWYCSLLVWQAFYEVLGVDLDPNGGIMVYPNDLISSPYFDNDSLNQQKRVRF